MNLSLHQLNTITKTTLCKTVSALVNEQIILEARRLLLATSGQVKEIPVQLGYEDVSCFIRFIKKIIRVIHLRYTAKNLKKSCSIPFLSYPAVYSGY